MPRLTMPSISTGAAGVAAGAGFYDAVPAALGGSRAMDFGEVIGFGAAPKPEFWIGPRTCGIARHGLITLS